MNDAEVASVLSPAARNTHPTDQRLGSEKPHKEFFLPPRANTAPLNGEAKATPDGNGHNDDAASVKADSEAETIIQSGREELSPEKKRKYIQHKVEHNGGKRSHNESLGTRNIAAGDDFKARKRKRLENDHGESVSIDARHQSRPNSRVSSPTPRLKREKTEDSVYTAATHAPSLSRAENINVVKSIEHKKHAESEADDTFVEDRTHGKYANQGVSTGRNARREERNTLAHSRHLSHDRSVSPAVRSHKRGLSTSSQSTSRSQKKRFAAPPLITDRHRHSSEDRESSASSTRGSPLPVTRPRRVLSTEHATSPAKQMPPKRQRDQNGRTRLARACAAQEVEAAKARYAAHPEELDVPDNAGNTPLQIAALEGSADIVKFLLEAGCDINTKNIDKDTPLIDAVENGHLDVVKLLLNAGANPRVGNAEGDEPYDLVPSDSENYDKLRTVLAEAKVKGIHRRKSVDMGSRGSAYPTKEASSRGASAASPRDSPPVFGARNSPPAGLSRRRTVRSEATRNDLLWTRPTPENLRDFAAKGDMAGVANILNVLQKADTESLIAAAKGSHDEVLGILLGMGNPDPNPEPIKSGNHKPGYNTPILAAIGRGNNSVIKLLLDQRGFDPTRLDHRGRTYYQISEERKGENWEAERKLLRDAYDNYLSSSKAAKSDVRTSKKSRDVRNSLEDSVSPASSHRRSARSPESRNQHHGSSKINRTRKDGGKDESLGQASTKSHRKTPHDDANSEYHTTSDHDSTRSRHTKQKLPSDSKKYTDSGTAANYGEEPIKRRRLIAGRPPDRRRGSFMSTDSHSPRDEASKERVEKFSHETRRIKEVSPSKRTRGSVSPEPHQSRGRPGESSEDSDPQKKKRKVEIECSPTRPSKESMKKTLVERPPSPKPISQPKTTSSASTGSEKTEIGHTMHENTELKATSKDVEVPVSAQKLQYQTEPKLTTDAAIAEVSEHDTKENGQPDEHPEAKDSEQKGTPEDSERIHPAMAAMSVKDEISEVKEVKEDEATKQAAKLALEQAEQERRREEEERKRKEAEERRIRQAEEEHQRRIEEEHRQARLRKEQEKQEQRRRDALPHRLRAAANLIGSDDPKAKSVPWLNKLVPVFTVRTKQLDSSCNEEGQDERWVINYQVAPLLASNDLQLSQYPSWERRIATSDHRYSLWRVTRSMLSYIDELPVVGTSWDDVSNRVAEIKPKFYSMEHVFWVKLSDFMDLVPHTPHLHGLDLRLTGMVIYHLSESGNDAGQAIQKQAGTSGLAN
ncbi:ankyrin repeat protein [Coccidioides immitis RS]|uniref:Ankyrin repeat protein n=3 Tax=Coccidioides immitis TaxID=5501 RepID=A0A0E1S321_COCIM|nr:ankyrin repeat protein [Coccidioides immitis RS]EAS32899.1 ankyrin repeat protein [Coccidioides immitis RS]KMP08174.1 hypothetical protein CIRG_07855 [Coccidioides immitis RMSCC 2394]KMU89880.1 nasopharyngeal carcinoma susceptibility protein LZ16 [Coccidioides immitis H538.4]TPX19874.1 Set3 complex subunit with deacetylase activity [Coccidioides immitis]